MYDAFFTPHLMRWQNRVRKNSQFRKLFTETWGFRSIANYFKQVRSAAACVTSLYEYT